MKAPYFDGMRKEMIWDERLTGRRVHHAVASCQASPASRLLHVFGRVWPR